MTAGRFEPEAAQASPCIAGDDATNTELQALNDALTLVNGQLQSALERQRVTANDLQNVLYSTDVATIFLDTSLVIRFFTPATRSLFNVVATDIGRPLAALDSLAADEALLNDARTVLRTRMPVEREIEARTGAWYIRRILPYRTEEDRVEGVVITFADITLRRQVAEALGATKRQADLANEAKSRFLAAASHDLRQPLQTLALLQGLLARTVEGPKAHELLTRFDETLAAMASMLNALLDINRIDAGTVSADIVVFPIDGLLERLRDEFNYHAQARGLELRVVPCSLSIRSDPHLLEQMVRNLLSNALKYTQHGKVLLGCRRRPQGLGIEILDTGIGIPEAELEAIFAEHYQLGNAGSARDQGLGLGLSIVRRLGGLLGHRTGVRSRPGHGSAFFIDVGPAVTTPVDERPAAGPGSVSDAGTRTGAILVVEDDAAVRDLLELLLQEEGHRTAAVADGPAALALVTAGDFRPDLILADYNLANGSNGLQVTAALREKLGRHVPVIILTGDISTQTLRTIALHNELQLHKPVNPATLSQAIQRLLAEPPPVAPLRAASNVDTAGDAAPAIIFVVDDDDHVRVAIREVLQGDGLAVEDYATGEAFLAAYRPGREACLLVDAYLPGISGLELLHQLHEAGHRPPFIMITGSSDVPTAVQAMRAGALDFIEKPVSRADLLASVERALEQSRDDDKRLAWQQGAARQVAGLTDRQRQIMQMVLAGHPSKNIAADLGISQRTVENHRAAIMKKTGTRSMPALARLALAAAPADA